MRRLLWRLVVPAAAILFGLGVTVHGLTQTPDPTTDLSWIEQELRPGEVLAKCNRGSSDDLRISTVCELEDGTKFYIEKTHGQPATVIYGKG